jgi:hypothetical protein
VSKYPITGIAGCCARATTGHDAALPSAAMKVRRFIRWIDIQPVESKRVDEFENMSDEELRQYIYRNKELDS